MNRIKAIQVKAAFLIIIFSLNTIIGFACAIGMDMDFNTPHHDEKNIAKISVHIHDDGKKHVHQNETEKPPSESDKNHHKATEDKANCCNDQVIKFNETDKSASHSLVTNINPVFFTTFLASYYISGIFYTSYINTSSKYFVRSYHPPIPDIRIAICSFQI